LNARSNQVDQIPPQVLEVNPKHPLMVNLYNLKDDPSSTAALVAQQMFDNTLMAAGLLEDPRSMIPRLNDILLKTLHQK
jgi:TNF receptor-associated protein 1